MNQAAFLAKDPSKGERGGRRKKKREGSYTGMKEKYRVRETKGEGKREKENKEREREAQE